MTYYGAKELAASFRTVRNNTIKIAEDIGEQHYGFRAAPETRTVAAILVHIALTPKLQEQIHAVERRSTLEGFDFPGFLTKLMAEEQKPRDKKQIVAQLREDGERFATWLDGLTDDFLGERVAYPAGMTPPSKSRFEMILGVKEHEMHHRGQLMLIERMIGMVPHLTREMQARIAAAQSRPASA
ncbi:MAG TPA: DinB family protein [Bryobacteraceae bacterium]|nr:DinB family protein [Bryobacteraceae bacterium]